MNISAATRGLALGDIYSRQNGVHRLALISQRRLRRYEQLDYFSNFNQITTRPEPYVHGFAPEILGLKASDDAEWFYFSREIIRQGKNIDQSWIELSHDHKEIRARLGTKAGLRNLYEGLFAPASGHDNPHYFDNMAMIRALGIFSAFNGSESQLVDLVRQDAYQTHSEDGVWLAMASAVLAYRLRDGSNVEAAISAAKNQIPDQSWGARELQRAINLSFEISNAFERVFILERDFVDRIYPYPYAAPESFGLICAHLIHNPEPALMFAASFQHRRHTDSLPAFIGFFMGLIHGESWMPYSFLNQDIVLEGVSIPATKGKILI